MATRKDPSQRVPPPSATPSGNAKYHAHATSATARKKRRNVMPAVASIADMMEVNDNFRNIIWTGVNMQVTSMTIPRGGEIGLEVHPDTDQVLIVSKGTALVRLSTARLSKPFESTVSSGDFIMVPSGTWHNVINVGRTRLKIVSMYAPPHHTPNERGAKDARY